MEKKMETTIEFRFRVSGFRLRVERFRFQGLA